MVSSLILAVADLVLPVELWAPIGLAISGALTWLVKATIGALNTNADSIKVLHGEVVSLTQQAIRALTENTAVLTALKQEIQNVNKD